MWIAAFGRIALVCATLAGALAAVLLYDGDRRGDPQRLRWGLRALWTMVAAVTAATALLEAGLVGNDFRLVYVSEHSSLQTPLAFRMGALWGGNSGSLLFWALVLSLYIAYLMARPPREAGHLQAGALAVLAAIGTFFCLLVTLPASPFRLLAAAPADGAGLNRLLRSDSFLLHPVALYLGFVGFSVPFAYGMAGLLRGDTGDHWIRVTHRWALAAWALLSVGILMGANWSYHVLGWGGYWEFDPVENAALLPWLTGTAFIHSAMVQERRGMLKVWNAVLIAATYLLTIFGTFLARSGLATSVHTFAESSIGGWFLVFLGVAAAFAVYLIGSRLDLLRDERELESLVSREGAFLLNNVVFVALALTIFVGTVVPLVSPFFGQTISVGEPYFNRVTAPLFTLLLLLAGMGPLLAWRRSGRAAFVRHLLVPLLAAGVFAFVLTAAGVHPLSAAVAFSCAFFAAVAVLYDVGLGVAARLQMEATGVATALYRLISRNPRRYGGYAVHLALALIAFGVVASHAFQQQGEYELGVGQTAVVGGYGFTYEGLGSQLTAEDAETYARVVVSRQARLVTVLAPSQSVGADAATAAGITYGVAIDRGLLRDLYVVLDGYAAGGGRAVLQIFVNPLVSWLWLGGALLVAGCLFSLWPRPEMLAAPRSHRIFSLWSELEYDYRMGKVADADYLALRSRYAVEAEAALRAERRGDGPRSATETAGGPGPAPAPVVPVLGEGGRE
jgi:cytochrome c-type biogenesis protein CcmF